LPILYLFVFELFYLKGDLIYCVIRMRLMLEQFLASMMLHDFDDDKTPLAPHSSFRAWLCHSALDAESNEGKAFVCDATHRSRLWL
jgi:hypothetical protein